jgi:hypothetical protein
MKTAIVLLGLATAQGAFASIFKRAACNADDCLRGVRGTNVAKPPLATRQADCSRYMTRTVTPSAV